ncbi:MAG: hypothetical protein KKF89_03000 [Nanoarchaeota archaeon]|nr:hypothetical protein [Nanoarchaeota archaeon]MBU1854662.1 hypothetical protein [Nanoarchaeota archaeon]
MIMLALGKKLKEEVNKNFEKQITDLSKQELKELLLINTYKLALVRSQLEAITNILIKKKLATYEEIWNNTNDNFKESTI